MTGFSLSVLPGLSAQAVTADYRFQNNESSSVAGAPDLVNLIAPAQTCPAYCNGFGSDNVLGDTTTVLQFPKDNGVALSPTTSVLSDNGIYTIAVLFKVQDVSGFRRIADFKNGTSDTGLYLQSGALVLYPNAPSANAPVVVDTYVQVVVTRDGSGMFKGYVNGVLQFTVDDSVSQYGLIDSSNALRFFEDNVSGGAIEEDSAGAVSRIRIYDGALTPEQVGLLSACTLPPANMISWWPGDNDANDIQGANNGILQNGTAFGAGEVKEAFSFDGNDDYVEVADSPSLNPVTVTADAWINSADVSGNHNVLFKGNHAYLLQIRDGNVLFGSKDSSGSYAEFQGSLTVPANTWTHVAITHDGAKKRIYVNGVLDPNTQDQSGLFTGDTNPLKIGTHYLLQEFFAGRIDEVEVFSRALTGAEIESIYDARSAGKCKPCVTPPANLIGWWPGDGNALDLVDTNDGAPSGNVGFVPGKVAQAFSFDGASVEFMGNPPSLNLTGNQVTLDGWVNPISATEGVYFGKSSSGRNDYTLYFLFGQLAASIKSAGTEFFLYTGFIPPNGQWTHIAMTYDGTNEIVYANGSIVGTLNVAALPGYISPRQY